MVQGGMNNITLPSDWAPAAVGDAFEIMLATPESLIGVRVATAGHGGAFAIFIFLWVLLLIEEHSGHDVSWAPYHWMPFACPVGGGAAPHDIHHYKVNRNFGFVLVVWDHLFGTYEPVVVPPKSPGTLKLSDDRRQDETRDMDKASGNRVAKPYPIEHAD